MTLTSTDTLKNNNLRRGRSRVRTVSNEENILHMADANRTISTRRLAAQNNVTLGGVLKEQLHPHHYRQI